MTESKDSREWTLHVKSPQARDSGIYECQVNTEPKISMAFQLNVIGKFMSLSLLLFAHALYKKIFYMNTHKVELFKWKFICSAKYILVRVFI